MKYSVKHLSDVTDRELNKMTEQLKNQEGKYVVLDRTGKSYGKYTEFEDAEEHAETLNEMEEL